MRAFHSTIKLTHNIGDIHLHIYAVLKMEFEMNGEAASDIISNDDNHIKYNEKKRMSLTLPLLNVVSTNPICEQSDNNEAATFFADAPKSTDDESNQTKKKIYESDDTFMQTIFSQTIKSTTATPTDDEPSHSFDAFVKSTSKVSTVVDSKNEHDNAENGADDGIDRIDNISEPNVQKKFDDAQTKPETAYTYFHKTIDEDDATAPDLDGAQDNPLYSPSTNNTITTTTTVFSQSFDRTPANISIKFKENRNVTTHQSFDNSLNDKSTASASNDTNHDTEHSLAQSCSFDSIVSVHIINTLTHAIAERYRFVKEIFRIVFLNIRKRCANYVCISFLFSIFFFAAK